ncbi:hypothetical protein HYPSUDRAFT_34642 [Hypholoma sublateritium FD-334 SS-4]|uniref:DUF6533 domain-containing protein n=1 Tax=Hypholoma sublateritium (strain FD-334 SS-4) TaxID=945553 RepID=A0A0D2PIH5_HYPSF|nr:hypothetical protein HYPSUDRAFT_34642 [Hypholoma sublateritium FD-334 SS-4]
MADVTIEEALSGIAALAHQYATSDVSYIWQAEGTILEARYAIAAIFGLQVYEWISGLQEEIHLIHRARWTLIKTLYLLCRYYPMALWLVVMWAYVGDHDGDTCSRVARGVHAVLAPCQFFSQAVMLMRAYGFAGRSKRVLALLGSFYVGLLGVDIWAFCTHVEIPPPAFYFLFDLFFGGTGCFPNYGSNAMAVRIGASMLAAIVMDFLSLVVVVVFCIHSGWHRDVSLARYFVHQGLTAFAFVSCVSVTTAITFFRPPRYHTGVGIPLILVIPNLVACRVILQLRAQVIPTESELERRHSGLVRDALRYHESDSWVIKDDTLP